MPDHADESVDRGIVLKNSFWGDERNFLELLMRFTRGVVKGPYRFVQNRPRTFVAALNSEQQQRSLKINFREIFRVVRFSTFATWGNSGIEPDKGKGISSPGTYEAGLMWPRNDGERQWSTMSDWTCR